jgi:hypothetical protein
LGQKIAAEPFADSFKLNVNKFRAGKSRELEENPEFFDETAGGIGFIR